MTKGSSPLHILDPTGFEVQLKKSIVDDDAFLPRLEMTPQSVSMVGGWSGIDFLGSLVTPVVCDLQLCIMLVIMSWCWRRPGNVTRSPR